MKKINKFKQFSKGLLFPLEVLKFMKNNPGFIWELKWCFIVTAVLFPTLLFLLFFAMNKTLILYFTKSIAFAAATGLFLNIVMIIFIYLFMGDLIGILGLLIAYPFLKHPCNLILNAGLNRSCEQTGFLEEIKKLFLLLPLIFILMIFSLLSFIPVIGIFIKCLTIPLSIIICSFIIMDFPLSLDGKKLKYQKEFMRTNLFYFLGFGLVCYLAFLNPLTGFIIQPFAITAATLYYIETETGKKANEIIIIRK